MNLRQAFASIGLVAGTALAFTATPAQAAKLVASDLGLQTLSADAPIGNGASSTKASFPYSTSSFTPSQDLNVKFSLQLDGLGSRGMGLSSFGYSTIVNGVSTFTSIFSETIAYNSGSSAKANDWLGTCGGAITGMCEVTVNFAAGATYQLGLLSKGISNYAVAAMDQFTFNTSSDQYYQNGTVAGHKNPFTTVSSTGALFIGLEDGEYKKSGNNYYYDYQDWVVKAEAVPEPMTLAGLGVVAGGLLVAKRRRTNEPA